nr:MAG TPA: hypothetical protein [Caudoviricetes sp.]
MVACKNIVYDGNNKKFYCNRFKGYTPKGCIEERLICFEPVLTEKMKILFLPKKRKGGLNVCRNK